MFLGLLVVGARMICLVLLLFQSFFLTLASSESERALRNQNSSDNTHWNSSAGHFTLCAACGPPVALFSDAAKIIRLYFKWPGSLAPFTTQFNWGHASSSDAGKSWKLLLDFLKSKGAAPGGKEIEEPSFEDGGFCRVGSQESSGLPRLIDDIRDNGKMPTVISITKNEYAVFHNRWTKNSSQSVHNFLCLRPGNGNDYFTYVLFAHGTIVSIVAMEKARREFGNGSLSSISSTGSGHKDEVSALKVYDFRDQCRSLDHFQLEKEHILAVFCWTEEDLKYVVGKWQFEGRRERFGARLFPGRLEFRRLESGLGHLYRGEEETWTFLDGAVYRPRHGAAFGVAHSGIISMGWHGGVGVNGSGYRGWVPYQRSFMTLRELSIFRNGVITAKPWINTALLEHYEFAKYETIEGRRREINQTYRGLGNISGFAKGAGAIVFELSCTLKSDFKSRSNTHIPLEIRFWGLRGLRVALEDKNETSVTLHIAARQKDTESKTCWTPSSPPPKKYKWSYLEPECRKQIELPYKWSSQTGGDSITVVLDKQTATVYAFAGRVVVSMAHSVENWTNLDSLTYRTEEKGVDIHSAKLFKYAPVEVTDVYDAMAKIEAQKIEAEKKAQEIEARKKREAQEIEARKKREAEEIEAQKKREAERSWWVWPWW